MSHKTHVSNKPLPKRMERVLAAGMAIRRRDVLATGVRNHHFSHIDPDTNGMNGIQIQVNDYFNGAQEGIGELVFCLRIMWPVAWPQTGAVEFKFAWSSRANPDETGPALGSLPSRVLYPITFEAPIVDWHFAFPQATIEQVVKQFANQKTNTYTRSPNAAKEMLCNLLTRFSSMNTEAGLNITDNIEQQYTQHFFGQNILFQSFVNDIRNPPPPPPDSPASQSF